MDAMAKCSRERHALDAFTASIIVPRGSRLGLSLTALGRCCTAFQHSTHLPTLRTTRYYLPLSYLSAHKSFVSLWKASGKMRSRAFFTSGERSQVSTISRHQSLDQIFIIVSSVQDPASKGERGPSCTRMGRSWKPALERSSEDH